jgi:uncharacterized protein
MLGAAPGRAGRQERQGFCGRRMRRRMVAPQMPDPRTAAGAVGGRAAVRLARIALLTLVFGYLGAGALLYTQQRRVLFPGAGSRKGPALEPHLPETGPIVVHFHGNAERAADLGWLRLLWEQVGAGFVAIEYPGYGGVPGEPTEEGIYAAAQAALDELVARGIEKDRLVLVGQSLGSGPAVEMARRGWGSRLVLLTPFTSVGDVAQAAYPWLPARWLVRDRFDSASKASEVKIPVLVVHGDQDEVIPYALGQRLAPMFPQGSLLTITGGHHNDLWDREQVVRAILEFVTRP